ncbi:MAG: hypothetical protein ABIK95_12725 [Acidobacteriota bacterium]
MVLGQLFFAFQNIRLATEKTHPEELEQIFASSSDPPFILLNTKIRKNSRVMEKEKGVGAVPGDGLMGATPIVIISYIGVRNLK